MQNLRDKLLKAGLVDKKAKKKADHQERKKRTAKKRQGQDPEAERKNRQAEFERRRAEQREDDRTREASRQAEQRAEAERRDRELAEAQAADRDAQRRLQQIYRARELVQASMFLPPAPGPVRFHFVSRSGSIRYLDLSTRVAHELDRGQVAIAQLPGHQRWGLIRRDVVEQVLEIEPALIRFFAPDGAEIPIAPPEADPQETSDPDSRRKSIFNSEPDSPGGRRER